ncbi:MAG: hypothetical protein OXB86_04375 [Bdellovibrionales bacterium]|nr:hypothetical protein [Bdellovibrionales bacterium]
MLKKLFKIGLCGFLLSSLAASADSVQVDRKDIRRDKKNPETAQEALIQSWDRYGAKCENDSHCKELCTEYTKHERAKHRKYKRDMCLKLPILHMEVLKKVRETIKNPSLFTLEAIDNFDLAVFGIFGSFKKPFRGYLASETKAVLHWIAENEDVAEYFSSLDESEELLEKLMDNILGSNWAENVNWAGPIISANENFMQIALFEGNTTALEWADDFFYETCFNKTEYGPDCVFKKFYCSQNFTEDQWDDLFTYDHIEDMLDEILTNFTTETPPAWWGGDVDSVSIPIDEISSLCEMNLVRKNKAQ